MLAFDYTLSAVRCLLGSFTSPPIMAHPAAGNADFSKYSLYPIQNMCSLGHCGAYYLWLHCFEPVINLVSHRLRGAVWTPRGTGRCTGYFKGKFETRSSHATSCNDMVITCLHPEAESLSPKPCSHFPKKVSRSP